MIGAPGAGKIDPGQEDQFQVRNPLHLLGGPSEDGAGRRGRPNSGADKKLNKRMAAAVDSGAMVSSETANALVVQRIKEKDAANGFVLDGYPFHGR